MTTQQPGGIHKKTDERNSASFSGRSKKTGPFFFQPRLSVGAVNDAYEKEADNVAEKVMRMPLHNDPPFFAPKPLPVNAVAQRKCEACEKEEQQQTADEHGVVQTKALPAVVQRLGDSTGAPGEAPDTVEKTVQSAGKPLDGGVRGFMEGRFGYDFSQVRIHDNADASRSAQSINALAYTHKNNIVFNQGQYAPDTHTGKKLLAHELTHVVQQGARRGAAVQRRPRRMRDIRHPKLALYQADAETNFFRQLAVRKAREIGAVEVDLTPNCPTNASFGAIPYYSGADIIEILAKVAWCTEHQVEEVHIFSHGNFHVIDASEGTVGRSLYYDPRYAVEAEGGRSVGDIPPEVFSSNARIILHGCQTAMGDDNIAERLLAHLLGTSPGARVYGHSESGTCGRTTDWREYSGRHPDGRRVRTNPYHPPRTEP